MEGLVKVPVKDGLFQWTSPSPMLVVSGCSACGELVFPKQDYCPECCTDTMEEKTIGSLGKLVCFTGITSPPPGFKGTVPYTVGIVEFPEGIRILGVMTEKNIDRLIPGMDIEIVMDTAFIEDEKEFLTYKFKPIQ
ncbi:Zn-ribbon domain-containing OB-fold protein [Bacillus sp. FJAT-29814]|uniref:Zn-ribbon domain-containing OB-fold protein n=1 Tax=Bacillus sp. FJAT-29814 TaxID=1729688 RepID=UPI00082E9647|nr:OB-fold domain-containing protein [Bacillus sp. FJAT-29814]